MGISNNVEKIILSFLSEKVEPQGTGSIQMFLEEKGVVLGEATVGRFLRKLNNEGYLEKIGYRGRTLTAKGRCRLEKLLLLEDKKDSLDHFGQFFFAKTSEYLHDILVARRALESEAAALAALHATEDDLREMGEILMEMERLVNSNKSAAATDAAFHKVVAKASGNQVIESAVQLIRHGGEDSLIFERIRSKAGSRIGHDHKEIYQAIRGRDPQRARQLMTDHMEKMLVELDVVEARMKQETR